MIFKEISQVNFVQSPIKKWFELIGTNISGTFNTEENFYSLYYDYEPDFIIDKFNTDSVVLKQKLEIASLSNNLTLYKSLLSNELFEDDFINGFTENKLVFLKFNSQLFGEELFFKIPEFDKEFYLKIDGSANYLTIFYKTFFKDNLKVYSISDYDIGFIIPSHNLIVIDLSKTSYATLNDFYSALQTDSFEIKFGGSFSKVDILVDIHIKQDEYLYSTNPTFAEAFESKLLYPYVTTIGLYDENRKCLGVCKFKGEQLKRITDFHGKKIVMRLCV